MNVLALEGALNGFSCAAAVDARVAASTHVIGNVALEAGLGIVSDVMQHAGWSEGEIARVAVGVGPGGFTGLRITISYAKSLAQAWKLPLVAVSSFDILEFGVDSSHVLSIVNGRPGVISARYRDGATVRRASGRVDDALRAVLPAHPTEPFDVVNASEDAVAWLAERGYMVKLATIRHPSPAIVVALLAGAMEAAPSVHAVRADYGEAPAAQVPRFGERAR